MAMLRAENEGFIKFKVEVDIDDAYAIIDEIVLRTEREYTACAVRLEDSYKRLLNPRLLMKRYKKAKADTNSIQVLLII
jgi:uncharacterized protein